MKNNSKWFAFSKAIKCIEGSETDEQLKAAYKYTLLWYELFKDYSTYIFLYNTYTDRFYEICKERL